MLVCLFTISVTARENDRTTKQKKSANILNKFHKFSKRHLQQNEHTQQAKRQLLTDSKTASA